MIRKFRISTSLILIFMILTILGGCEQKVIEDTRPVAKGFIWEATNSNGEVVTLVGTMHPAPSTHVILHDKLKDILNNADVLTVEVDTTAASAITQLRQNMYLKKEDTMDNYLSSEEISKLSEMLKPYNQNIKLMKSFNPYGINQVLAAKQYEEIGFNGMTTDVLLMNDAKRNNIEVDEIEGLDFQINLMDDIYNWDDLKEYIEEYNDKLKGQEIELTNKIFENYVNSDIESAEKLEVSLKEEAGKLYNVLNIDRNKGMANKIDELIKDGKKRIVAVGYRHYIGEDSVLSYLEEKGYTIKKIEM